MNIIKAELINWGKEAKTVFKDYEHDIEHIYKKSHHSHKKPKKSTAAYKVYLWHY